MRDTTRHDLVSVEEYLRIEEASVDVRHEYVRGVLYAMAGATRRHNQIVLNIASRLLIGSGDSPCAVHAETVKVRVAEDVIYYPDVVVTCDPADSDPLIINHPCLVIEVLSPSSITADRGSKLHHYLGVPDLQGYLVVYLDEQRVEWYWRNERDGTWQLEFKTDGAIQLPCPQIELSLTEVYRGLPLASDEVISH
jgi:Uma2 family endonuclease